MSLKRNFIHHMTQTLPILSHLLGSGLWLGQGHGTWDRGWGQGWDPIFWECSTLLLSCPKESLKTLPRFCASSHVIEESIHIPHLVDVYPKARVTNRVGNAHATVTVVVTWRHDFMKATRKSPQNHCTVASSTAVQQF